MIAARPSYSSGSIRKQGETTSLSSTLVGSCRVSDNALRRVDVQCPPSLPWRPRSPSPSLDGMTRPRRAIGIVRWVRLSGHATLRVAPTAKRSVPGDPSDPTVVSLRRVAHAVAHAPSHSPISPPDSVQRARPPRYHPTPLSAHQPPLSPTHTNSSAQFSLRRDTPHPPTPRAGP